MAGSSRQTSGASQKREVEGLARKVARENVTSPSRRAQKEEQIVHIKPAKRSTEVPLRREQLDDEGLAVVIRAMESGIEPEASDGQGNLFHLEIKRASIARLPTSTPDKL